MFRCTDLYFFPVLYYLVHNFCKLWKFTQLHKVQPGHIEDPAKWFGRAGFQIQGCSSWGKAAAGIRSAHVVFLEIYFPSHKNKITILQKKTGKLENSHIIENVIIFFGTFPSSPSVLFTGLYHLIKYRWQFLVIFHYKELFLGGCGYLPFYCFFNNLKYTILISMNRLIFSCVILKITPPEV